MKHEACSMKHETNLNSVSVETRHCLVFFVVKLLDLFRYSLEAQPPKGRLSLLEVQILANWAKI
ncbi:MAG: hypothetical protein A2271_02265 [Candidatus Moranbacteria bacterium RIFOXYA12_FULL_35_19]|nr:MAG: hypothetical protein A2343_02385 [Candidatus Moranbacteria bacterium RIFOXYB12_FULL_35_8]OGI35365.1 MAG: hypothetical protein A2271_02265 [Candidatus Moranbacteria bacterium RIFOXYA12_FULL_35_19]